MTRYTRIDDALDPSVRIEGATLPELFENAGFAAFDLSYNLANVPPTYSRPVVAPGDSIEELLANWIDELVAWSRSESLVWSFFVVDRLEPGGVQGSAAGLPHSEVPARSRLVTGVDRLGASVVEVPDGYWVDVTFRTEPRLRSIETP